AEDGIRDRNVTGVQTCALPISVVGDKVGLAEIYPPQLPDLFHGGQVTVFGRYTGSGPVAIKLSGTVGKEAREFVYETNFTPKTRSEERRVGKECRSRRWPRRCT